MVNNSEFNYMAHGNYPIIGDLEKNYHYNSAHYAR